MPLLLSTVPKAASSRALRPAASGGRPPLPGQALRRVRRRRRHTIGQCGEHGAVVLREADCGKAASSAGTACGAVLGAVRAAPYPAAADGCLCAVPVPYSFPSLPARPVCGGLLLSVERGPPHYFFSGRRVPVRLYQEQCCQAAPSARRFIASIYSRRSAACFRLFLLYQALCAALRANS